MTQTTRKEVDEILRAPPGPEYTKFHVRPNSHPISFRREPHGQYEIFRRPNDFLVTYYPAIGDVGAIAPMERVGVYPTLDSMVAAVAAHDRERPREAPVAVAVPQTTRRAEFVKEEIERRTGGKVSIGPLSKEGGHHLIVEDPASGHRETFGVSRYGITPGEVRFGSSGQGGDKFIRVLRATINKAGKIK